MRVPYAEIIVVETQKYRTKPPPPNRAPVNFCSRNRFTRGGASCRFPGISPARRALSLAGTLLISLVFAAPRAGATNAAPEITQPLPRVFLGKGGAPGVVDLKAYIADPDVPGTAARITTRIGSQYKTVDLALFDAQTPITVANFLTYIQSGRYTDNFIHRSATGFVIQGGGFRWVGPTTYGSVPTYSAIQNEPGISNLRGTIAMAKIGGDPNSATSQWFINLADNSANLNFQNGGFTVFGRVLGAGMDVVDEIAALPKYNVTSLNSAWGELPLKSYASPLSRVHFIETTITAIPAITFTAISSDPDLLGISVVNGSLTLTPSANRSGTAVVTLTALDLEGATLETPLAVDVQETYTSWASGYLYPDPADTGPSADPDHNGKANLLEFAFGGNPVSAEPPDGFPVPESGGGIALRLRKNAALNAIVHQSSDLETWSKAWSSADGLSAPAVHSHESIDDMESIIIRLPPGSPAADQMFWRVEIAPTL